MEIEVVMTASVDLFRKGHTYLVDVNHWVAHSPYARVVASRETVVPLTVDTVMDDSPAPRVDRRRKKAEVTDDSPVGTESGGDQRDGEEEGS